jgi:alcohol/geraniol dehydrogenase (NADP+)
MTIHAYAALAAKTALVPFQYPQSELAVDQVEIAVQYSGLCHSDLSMIENEWQQSLYPLVPGHEVVGKISRVGSAVQHLHVGQMVGLGWQAGHCQGCRPCLGGKPNLCKHSEATIVGRHGGFASHVTAHWQWVIPLPEALSAKHAGPLLCGGLTVFTPLLQHNIQAIHHIGVIGIGGLGHLAIQIYKAWGCRVTAFTSSLDKTEELYQLGADHVVHSQNLKDYDGLTFDLIVDTVNAPLDWQAYTNLLAAGGRFHIVGLVLEPIEVSSSQLIDQQIAITGSPTGSPLALHQLLDFCSRHAIEPWIEEFPISQVNHAIEKMKQGQLRYRAVLNMQELHDAKN